ncbi:hypothetical protein BT93_J1611 [Corymbia citriodora subsp. variegata]|nr:hypothetical protein BT93_J1611 [Corymbia citriodora subsp. variegata]
MRTLEDVRIVLAKPAIDNPIPVSTEISGYQSFDTSFYPRAAVDVEPRGYTHRRNPSNWPRTEPRAEWSCSPSFSAIVKRKHS